MDMDGCAPHLRLVWPVPFAARSQFSRSHHTTGYWYQGNHTQHSIDHRVILASHQIFLATFQSPVLYCFIFFYLLAYYFIIPVMLQQKQYDAGTACIYCMNCTAYSTSACPLSFFLYFSVLLQRKKKERKWLGWALRAGRETMIHGSQPPTVPLLNPMQPLSAPQTCNGKRTSGPRIDKSYQQCDVRTITNQPLLWTVRTQKPPRRGPH
jgi:hypothetical protein